MKKVLVALTFFAVAGAGCAKSDDDSGGAGDAARTGSGKAPVVTAESAPFGTTLAQAGWTISQLRRFPGQVPGYKARTVVYRGRKNGGVLYVVDRADGPHALWHWYFDDAAPDSVAPLELNDDGLWDCRVYFGKKSRDFIQGEDFTLVAGVRRDLIALNGDAAGSGKAWAAFDGDSTTAWVCDESKAWIDVPTPVGVQEGVVEVQLAATDRPRSMRVLADGKDAQTFELAPKSGRQVFRFDAVPDARSFRLEFEARSGRVAVSELSIR